MTRLSCEINEDGFEMSLEAAAYGDEGSTGRAAFNALVTAKAYAAACIEQAVGAIELCTELDSLTDAVAAHDAMIEEMEHTM